jgi:hypothetical protein
MEKIIHPYIDRVRSIICVVLVGEKEKSGWKSRNGFVDQQIN